MQAAHLLYIGRVYILPFVRVYRSASLRSRVESENIHDYHVPMRVSDRHEWASDYGIRG